MRSKGRRLEAQRMRHNECDCKVTKAFVKGSSWCRFTAQKLALCYSLGQSIKLRVLISFIDCQKCYWWERNQQEKYRTKSRGWEKTESEVREGKAKKSIVWCIFVRISLLQLIAQGTHKSWEKEAQICSSKTKKKTKKQNNNNNCSPHDYSVVA